MAFAIQSWARSTASANTSYILPSGAGSNSDINGGPSIYTYFSSTDSLATISGANYFATVVSDLKLHDLVYVSGSDGQGFYKIAALNYSAKTITVSAVTVPSESQFATGTLTAAQFNGMYAAPVQLIAAAGANTLIIVKQLVLELVYGAAQFASGGVVNAQYDSTVHGGGTAATTTVAAATINGAAASSSLMLTGALALAANTTCVNKGIYLSNATGAFTTGDSTFNYYVWYGTVTTT